MFKIHDNPSPQSKQKKSATSAYQSYVNYVKQSVFTRNPNYEPMCLKTYMPYMFKIRDNPSPQSKQKNNQPNLSS
jgi:hypothetical protein